MSHFFDNVGNFIRILEQTFEQIRFAPTQKQETKKVLDKLPNTHYVFKYCALQLTDYAGTVSL